MKHVMGNSPRCDECRFYTPRSPEDKAPLKFDGICSDGGIRLGGFKGKGPQKVLANDVCDNWIDAEADVTRFEVETLSPEPWRKGFDRMRVEQAIQNAIEEQKDLGAWYAKRRQQQNSSVR